MLPNKFLVLKTIGEKPYYAKEQIADELDMSVHQVGTIIGTHRNFGRIVKAPPYDQEKGLEWELTGEGYRYVKESYRKLEKELGTRIPKPVLHQFKPRHARG